MQRPAHIFNPVSETCVNYSMTVASVNLAQSPNSKKMKCTLAAKTLEFFPPTHLSISSNSDATLLGPPPQNTKPIKDNHQPTQKGVPMMSKSEIGG